jgi:hypothetical protein
MRFDIRKVDNQVAIAFYFVKSSTGKKASYRYKQINARRGTKEYYNF